jgi:hypothetical protein
MRALAAGLAALALIATASPAFSDPPAAMIISETKVFGTLNRAPVSFTHDYHASGMSCAACHHDKFGKGIQDPGRLTPGNSATRCATCHSTPAELQQAFHQQCITCHDKLKRPAGRPGAPRLCGECHVWQR